MIIGIIFFLISIAGIYVYVISVRKNIASASEEEMRVIKVWGLSPFNFLMFMCFMLFILEFISSFPFQQYMHDRDAEITMISKKVDSLKTSCNCIDFQLKNSMKDIDWLKNNIVNNKPVKSSSANKVYVNNGRYNTNGKSVVQNN